MLNNLYRVTEKAALAAFSLRGFGDKNQADKVAVDAMRRELNRELPAQGVIIIGEGEKDQAPGLFNGETLGNPTRPLRYDIAVDPIDGTSSLVNNIPGAVSVLAIAPHETICNFTPSWYMDKIVTGPRAGDAWLPEESLVRNMNRLATVLKKPFNEINVVVLDRPRHSKIVSELRALGVRVSLHSAGDIVGALLPCLHQDFDLLIGTGGTPEGVLASVAVRVLGGQFYGRINPQEIDQEQVSIADLDTETWYRHDEIITTNKGIYFFMTGITDTPLLNGVRVKDRRLITESLVITSQGIQRITSEHF